MTAIALTIAGSDSGGGAGIQADLKTFSALGVFGASVITAVTAQNTRAVTAVEDLRAELISAQIAAVRDDLAIDAIKIGMLSSVATIDAVADALAGMSCPVVLDPVMVAKSGDPLLVDEAVSHLRKRLLPLATVLTPNLPEAARLLDRAAADIAVDPDTMREQGEALRAMGSPCVLMKGGHAEGAECVDVLITASGATQFRAERVQTQNTHGTGCTLSSAIAAHLTRGYELTAAVSASHTWLHAAIRAADSLAIGSGHGPVHHFHALWPS